MVTAQHSPKAGLRSAGPGQLLRSRPVEQVRATGIARTPHLPGPRNLTQWIQSVKEEPLLAVPRASTPSISVQGAQPACPTGSISALGCQSSPSSSPRGHRGVPSQRPGIAGGGGLPASGPPGPGRLPATVLGIRMPARGNATAHVSSRWRRDSARAGSLGSGCQRGPAARGAAVRERSRPALRSSTAAGTRWFLGTRSFPCCQGTPSGSPGGGATVPRCLPSPESRV